MTTPSPLLKSGCALAGAAMLLHTALAADPMTARLTVEADRPGHAIPPMLHGIFYEDLNYAADGGLYAELVQNRSFEHSDHLFAWKTAKRGGSEGAASVETDKPLNAKNPHYLRLAVTAPGEGCGITNLGYDGIAVKEGENYLFSVHARSGAPGGKSLSVVLEDEQGRPLGECKIDGLEPQWKQFTGTIRSSAASAAARLTVLAKEAGQVDLDVVSLFPEKTFKGRRNGLRADLAQKLADMHPAFMRFPGGCIVEGKNLAEAYRWKDTIGDVSERPQNTNRWQFAMPGALAPQYYQSYGLGFFEFFQLCEDIGAEPAPVLNCGMACQYQTGELVPLDQLQPYVQDALDLVEFANGPADSPWGAKRAAMGHPKPFHLKYLGIGNEQWGQQYFDRYPIFYNALKAKYPDLTLITTAGPGVDESRWKLAWSKFKGGMPAQIVDEHYYRPPVWFLEQVNRYDGNDRTGPKVFAGEYAAHNANKTSTLQNAIYEAAFMTGLVRNSDVVAMSSYAPLFARVGHSQWFPDMIWFDNTRLYTTSSYHVQSLFSRHRGDVLLPSKLDMTAAQSEYGGRIGVGTWNTQAEFKDIQVIDADEKPLFSSDFSKGLEGWTTSKGKWEVADGALRQTATGTDVRALTGDPAWKDYTYSLKARKTGGSEGFLVMFQLPGDQEVSWWNIGGHGNKDFSLDAPDAPADRVAGTIETGRWYDIRVELQGGSVKCYLDGKLIHGVARKSAQSLYAVATQDRAAGEIILKVANVTKQPVKTAVDLRGVKDMAAPARATVLTSEKITDENSLDAPEKIVPKETTVDLGGKPQFDYTFPPISVTVLKIKAGM
jgi:alpha-L-arabinofuranosidase